MSTRTVVMPPDTGLKLYKWNALLGLAEHQTTIKALRMDQHPVTKREDESDKSFLERLFKRIIEHINAKEWRHHDWYDNYSDNVVVVAPSAYLELLREPVATSLEEYLTANEEFTTENPEYNAEVLNITANVDDDGLIARVWIQAIITGHPPTVARQTMTIVDLKKMDGKWWAYKQTGFRGPQETY